MSRYPRNYIKTTYFHVITQGIHKNYIFEREEDIKYYIKIMYNLIEKQKVEILAYCIMNNHAHMLIKAEEIKELSKYMQRLNTKYAIYYNKKYEKVGYVFRDRYKSEGIYTEEQLYCCINYIYNNPVKAGMCNKASEYPYSNHRKYKNGTTKNYNFIDTDENVDKCKDIIEEFLKENNLQLEYLRLDKKKLRELIIRIKQKTKCSLREIAECININRETIRQIYKE